MKGEKDLPGAARVHGSLDARQERVGRVGLDVTQAQPRRRQRGVPAGHGNVHGGHARQPRVVQLRHQRDGALPARQLHHLQRHLPVVHDVNGK